MHYKQALPPECWPTIERFLKTVTYAAKVAREHGRKVDVGAVMKAWHPYPIPTKTDLPKGVKTMDIKELYDNGFTDTEIARITGFSNGIEYGGCFIPNTNDRSGIVRGNRQFPTTTEAKGTWHNYRGGASSNVTRERWAIEPSVGRVADGLSSWLDGYWRVVPDIPRVATGIPNRMDRLKCLGNAVVPQQVYPIIKAIAEIESAKSEAIKC